MATSHAKDLARNKRKDEIAALRQPTTIHSSEITSLKRAINALHGLMIPALCEAYEESGLQVRLVRHLVDVRRTQTYTHYYRTERVGESRCPR